MFENKNNNTNGTDKHPAPASASFAQTVLAQKIAAQAVAAQHATPGAAAAPDLPDPQVQPKQPRTQRRKFSTAYKLAILTEVESCREQGQIGALLRREGLYSSHLTDWRRQQQQEPLKSKSSKSKQTEQDKRDQRRKTLSAQQRDRRRLAALEKENQKLHLIIDVQKKLSSLLEISLETPELVALRQDTEIAGSSE